MASNRRVPLASVRYINFHSDTYTISQRVAPIRQQTCIGEPCARFQPPIIQCENMGSDGVGGFQWKCNGDLPANIRFGELYVDCEGWEGPDDTNILHGSCGLTYNLVRINKGLEYGDSDPISPPSTTASTLFDIAFYGVLFIFIYTLIRKWLVRNAPRYAPPPIFGLGGDDGPYGGGGGGGGGWGGGPGGGGGGHGHGHGHGAPPPPYSKDPPKGSAYSSGAGAGAGPSTSGPSAARGQAGQAERNAPGPSDQDQAHGNDNGTNNGNGANPNAGWRPGFWTGLAGATAWTLFNNYRSDRDRDRDRDRARWGGGGWDGYNDGYRNDNDNGGGWTWGFGNSARTRPPSMGGPGARYRAQGQRQTYEGFWGVDGGGGQGGPGEEGAVREATGFGGTRTR